MRNQNWMRCAAAVGMLLAASAAQAQKVNVDSNPSANFVGYHSYAWTAGTAAPNPLAEQRIHASVEQQLAAKGITKATTATPDLYIATHVTTKEHQQLNVTGFGGWGYGFGGLTTASIQTSVVGTLVVDMYDAKTKMLVWRGVGSGTASDKADKNSAKADNALDKMFKQYPPRPGTK